MSDLSTHDESGVVVQRVTIPELKMIIVSSKLLTIYTVEYLHLIHIKIPQRFDKQIKAPQKLFIDASIND